MIHSSNVKTSCTYTYSMCTEIQRFIFTKVQGNNQTEDLLSYVQHVRGRDIKVPSTGYLALVQQTHLTISPETCAINYVSMAASCAFNVVTYPSTISLVACIISLNSSLA